MGDVGVPRLSAERLEEIERRTFEVYDIGAGVDTRDLIHDLKLERERAERLERGLEAALDLGLQAWRTITSRERFIDALAEVAHARELEAELLLERERAEQLALDYEHGHRLLEVERYDKKEAVKRAERLERSMREEADQALKNSAEAQQLEADLARAVEALRLAYPYVKELAQGMKPGRVRHIVEDDVAKIGAVLAEQEKEQP